MKQVAIITGASSGLGKEIAKLLLKKKNYYLILTGRNEKGLEEFMDSADVTIVVGDLTKKTTIDLIENAVNDQKRLDILINNAGITYVQPFLHNTEKQLDIIVEINLKAPMLLTRLLYPLMVNQQSGHIININAKSNHTMYSAVKFGLKGFTDALRLEAKPNNIRVTSIFPGGINTELYRNQGEIPKHTYMDPIKIAELIVQLIETDPSLSTDEIVINRMTK
jgi:short-subunit dehydrogenase